MIGGFGPIADNLNQAIRLVVGEGTEEHVANDAEHGNAGAETHGKHQNYGCREDGCLVQLAASLPQIARE